MAARIDQGDLHELARNTGRSGKALPSWAAAEPALREAYYAGAGTPDPQASTPPPQTPKHPAGGTRTSTRARAGGATRRRHRRPATGTGTGRARRDVSRRARDLARHPATLGTGTGGGLLLAVFAYPLAVSVLKYGPTGPGRWLRAKFLNQGPGGKPIERAGAPASNPLTKPTGPLPKNPPKGTVND